MDQWTAHVQISRNRTQDAASYSLKPTQIYDLHMRDGKATVRGLSLMSLYTEATERGPVNDRESCLKLRPLVLGYVKYTSVCVWYDGPQPVVPYTHTTGSKLRCQTPIKHTTNISEPLRISVKYSSIFPDDGSNTNRNMSE